MNPRLKHKIVEHILMTNTLLAEIIEDNDRDQLVVGRESVALIKGHKLLEEIKREDAGHEPKAESPSGGSNT